MSTFTQALDGALTPFDSAFAVYRILSNKIAKFAELIKGNALTPSGIIAEIRIRMLALFGAMATSGILATFVQVVKAGAATPSDVLAKFVRVVKLGAATPSGIITTIKSFVLALFGTQLFTDTSRHAVATHHAGLLGLQGAPDVRRLITMIVTGALTVFGTVAKFFTYWLTAALQFSGRIATIGGQPPPRVRPTSLGSSVRPLLKDAVRFP
jgi:hypothetical protein